MLIFKARRKDPTISHALTASERRVMKILGAAMQKVRAGAAANEDQIIDALRHLPVSKVVDLVPDQPWFDAQADIEDELVKELVASGQRTGSSFPKIRKQVLTYRFDADRPEAAAWAKKESAKLVTEIIEDQRNTIRDFVSASQMGDFTVTQVARNLRDVVGLTTQQSGWVDNFRNRAISDRMALGETFEQASARAAKETERYQQRIHRYRSETIARTEILRASSEGRNQAWQQGIAEGYISPDAQKQWVAEPDACEICSPLDGETVGITDEFPGGDPPLHPNCRCTLDMVDIDVSDFEDMSWDEIDAELDSLLSQQETEIEIAPEVSGEEIPLKSFAEIESMSEEIYQHYLDNEDKSGDQMLSKMYEVQGYNANPSIVTKSQMDALEEAGTHHIVYRGVDSKEFTDQYKYGQHFAGKGIYGNGSYTSTEFFRGEQYTSGVTPLGQESDVMKIAIPKSANIVDYEFASKKQYEEWKDKFLGSSLAETQVFADVGRWATANGYDAIKVAGGTENIPVKEDYFIILNRGKVTVQDKNVLGGSGG